MALRHAILATLLEGPASGYDLTKVFDAGAANYWAATPQQLYRELEKLTVDGLVSARLVEQTRRPNKRLFSLTDAGREELHASTTRPPKPIAIRDELLVQVQALDSGDPDAIRRFVEAKRTISEAKLQRFERRRERILDGRSEPDFLASAPRIGPYLTLVRGIAFEAENVQWCDFVLAALTSRLPD